MTSKSFVPHPMSATHANSSPRPQAETSREANASSLPFINAVAKCSDRYVYKNAWARSRNPRMAQWTTRPLPITRERDVHNCQIYTSNYPFFVTKIVLRWRSTPFCERRTPCMTYISTSRPGLHRNDGPPFPSPTSSRACGTTGGWQKQARTKAMMMQKTFSRRVKATQR